MRKLHSVYTCSNREKEWVISLVVQKRLENKNKNTLRLAELGTFGIFEFFQY